jgi:hypothetical protein
MTPFIDLGEAIHDPGILTMSILGDMGWINTRIIHDPVRDTEENLSQLIIEASIKSDTIYNREKVGIVVSFDEFETCDTTYLLSHQSDDNYTTTLTIPSYETRFEYYLFAEDKFSRIYRLPSLIEENKYSVYIGTDTVKPVISFTPQGYYFETVDTIRFDPVVTDNIGIDTVYIEYKINEGESGFLGLEPGGDDKYINALAASDLALEGGDQLQYRIVAVDKAGTPNQTVFPEGGYQLVTIEQLNMVDNAYSTNFTDAALDFFSDGISITRPAGFTRFGLHTPHPYVSPEETGDSIGYVAVLRTPVEFDGNGMIISFRELVLVEPGETGSLFGSDDFYDYVIVEASKNFGKSWFQIADGYDSRIIKSWEDAYNNAIEGQNSAFTGTESMMVKHTFFPKESSDISAGDTMMIRFRLFSDPYANGWGWVIEDLHIGPLIDGVEEIRQQSLVIYPNPGNGIVSIRESEGSILKPLRFSIINSAGISIMTDHTDGGSDIEIDISGNPAGLYFILLYMDNGVQTLKYNLIK